jgi:hypothetical protein
MGVTEDDVAALDDGYVQARVVARGEMPEFSEVLGEATRRMSEQVTAQGHSAGWLPADLHFAWHPRVRE